MRRIKCLLFILPMLLVSTTMYGQTKEVGGVAVAENKTYENQKLQLNGAGIREKWFLDLYVISLYLSEYQEDEESIMMEDENVQAIHLDIISGMITSEKMQKSVNEGFEKATKGNTKPIDGQIGRFISCFKEEIKDGDSFDFVYNRNKGVLVYKNGELLSTIEGHDFKEALFGIWLSEDPVDDKLKAALLGKYEY